MNVNFTTTLINITFMLNSKYQCQSAQSNFDLYLPVFAYSSNECLLVRLSLCCYKFVLE